MATTDLAQLGLEVRSDGVVTASRRLDDLENQGKKTEMSMDRLIARTERLSKQMAGLGKSMALRVTTPLLLLSGAAVKFAGDFESSFANIRKTVDATEPQFARMASQIRELSKVVPTSVDELNRLGGVAGQLGVESKNIVAFTRTIAMLGDTTDIAGEQAALSLSRFMNIMGTSQDQIDRIGSTVVGLGNNFAAMESEIVDGATSLAAFGRQLNFSEAQVLAYATAIAASGGETQAASSAFQKTAITMQRAVLETNEDLKVFASISGSTMTEFSRLFREDASTAMVMFLEGLKDISDQGQSTAAALEQLGLTDIRLQREFGKVIGNLDQLKGALEVANTEWENNTALTEEALTRYETFNSRVQILWNNVKDLGITIGNDLIPVVERLSTAIGNLVDKLQKMEPETRKNVLLFGALAAAIGPLLIILAVLTRSVAILTPVLFSMGGLFTAIGGAAAAAAVVFEREFVPGMDEVGKTEQTLNVLTRAWIILRETALGTGEAILGGILAVAGVIRGIVSPIEGAIRSLATALEELMSGNFRAAASALSPTNLMAQIQSSMADAQAMFESGLGFVTESFSQRIETAIDDVMELRNRLLETGETGEQAGEDTASGLDTARKSGEKFLKVLENITTAAATPLFPSSGGSRNTSGLLPKILSDNERIVDSLQRQKEALAGGTEAWEAYERSMAQAQAVSELGEDRTVAQIEAVRKLAGEIFDLQKAMNNMDAQRAFSRFFVELSDNGETAFRNLARSFRLAFIEDATSELFDLVDSFSDEFLDGFGDIAPEISTILQAALAGGAESAERAITSAIGAAIGAAVGGPEGAKIGALIGDLIGSTFGGGTPSSNAGLLLGSQQDFPGVDIDRLFGDFDLFGQEAQLFARREDQDSAISASRQFLQIEESIGNTLSAIDLGLDQFSINLMGLDENASGLGAFLGQAAEDGEAVGQSLAIQLLSVARQAIKQISQQQEGLIPPDVLQDILFPRGAATVVGDVTSAFNDFIATLVKTEDVIEEVIEEENKALGNIADFFAGIDDSFSDLFRSIQNDIARVSSEFGNSIQQTIDQQIRRLDDLRRQAISDHAEELRREEELHNTRLRLSDSLKQFATSLRIGDLSPLSNRERLQTAEKDFRATLNATLAGDVDAAGRLQGSAQSFAEVLRFMFASGPGFVQGMEEILTGLDSASGLLATSEFNPQAANDRLLTELQLINQQLSDLPSNMAIQLAPVMFSFIAQMMAAGESSELISNRIRGLGPVAESAAEQAMPGFVSENATALDTIRDAIDRIKADSSNELEALTRIRDAAVARGITSDLLAADLGLTEAQLQKNLAVLGMDSFATGGPIMDTGPAFVHRGEHVINADRDNLVVNVQSNTEGIAELRNILTSIRDNSKQYQEEDLKETKNIQRTLSDQAEALRKIS